MRDGIRNAILRWLYAFAPRLLLGVSLAVLLASACGIPSSRARTNRPPPPTDARIMGSVTYRERIALPPGSSVQFSLYDITRSDAPGVLIVEKTIVTKGEQVPILFELGYRRAQIQAKHKYGVIVRINKDGQLLFTNSVAFPALNEAPSSGINIIVSPPARN